MIPRRKSIVSTIYDIAVIGGGPAGLSAALNGRVRGKTVLILGNLMEENPLYKSEQVENYLGMSQISGKTMMDAFHAHALSAGAEWRTGRVLNILPQSGTFYIGVGNEMEIAKSVVIATGVVHAKKLSGEMEFIGRGVSWCATCDGMLYRGKQVAVVGKAKNAAEEANFLEEIGCKVTYVANARPQELHESIPFVKENQPEILGDQLVTALWAGGEHLPCDGVFVLRDSVAPVDLLPDLELKDGYVAVDRAMKTNLPGVFAAGDCTGKPLQIAKAVGEGLIAGQSAAEYVGKMGEA
jgi:thioredoxin reductase (NADPH)